MIGSPTWFSPGCHWSGPAGAAVLDQWQPGLEDGVRSVVTEGPGVPGSVQSRLLPDSVMFSPRPVDMSLTSPASETSPPPLTKLVHRKPSSPREFFEKLYGPDTSRDEEKSSSPGPETSVNTNINNNLQGSFPRCDSSNQPLLTSSYLPAFPLPPHEVGLINCSLDNVPFPGGLAAFRKYYHYYHFIIILLLIK